MTTTNYSGRKPMSQQKSNKRRGATFEIELADWFIENGLNAQRLPRAGRNDVGDVFVPGVNGIYIVEAKAPRRDGRIDLSGWIREAEVEALNYKLQKNLAVMPAPLVIIKASNRPIGDAYVVQRLNSVLPNL
jgi:Holliday junction resolvase